MDLNNLDLFTAQLKKRLQGSLPGERVQSQMAPLNRATRFEALKKDPDPRKGAVLVLFYQKDGKTHLLLMKRNEYDGPHSGQVCFPGGGIEPVDKDFYSCALREAHEELNVAPDRVQTIGELSQLYIPPSRYLVQPVAGIYTGQPAWKADDFEVNSIIEIEAHQLLNPENVKKGAVYVPSIKGKMNVPYFNFNGHIVWGATAMMLNELKYIMQ